MGRLARWRAHPLEYFVERLGVKRESMQWSALPEYAAHKWDGDVDPFVKVCEAVARSESVAIESAVGVGKTYFGACLMFWFLECWRNARVGLVAPKEKQLELHLWREANLMFPQFGIGEIMTQELRLDPRPHVWSAELLAAGVKAEEVNLSATKAQGFHGKDVLILCEETPGIAEAVMTAFENTCTAPHNMIVAFGNPDNHADTLHKFGKRQKVTSVRVSGFDHPNVVLKNPDFVPGAQSEVGLANLLDKYLRPTHPLYLSRARGLCPQQAANSLISWDWCVAAARRTKDRTFAGPKALGADVANSEAGDKAALAIGEGSVMESIEDFPCPNSNRFGYDIFVRAKQAQLNEEHIGVDGVGVGAGTVNELLRLGLEVVNIQSGAKPDEELYRRNVRMQEVFDNRRSQMWWLMMLDLKYGEDSRLVLPYDEELFTDLCTPTWSTERGVIRVESKETIKKRLGRSPNKGDAAVYWNYVRQAEALRGVDSKRPLAVY